MQRQSKVSFLEKSYNNLYMVRKRIFHRDKREGLGSHCETFHSFYLCRHLNEIGRHICSQQNQLKASHIKTEISLKSNPYIISQEQLSRVNFQVNRLLLPFSNKAIKSNIPILLIRKITLYWTISLFCSMFLIKKYLVQITLGQSGTRLSRGKKITSLK